MIGSVRAGLANRSFNLGIYLPGVTGDSHCGVADAIRDLQGGSCAFI